METKTKKEFDAVEYMREQRKSLSDKLSKLSKPEIVEFFKKKQLQQGTKPSA